MPYQLYDNIGKGLGYKINSTVDASSLGTNTTWKGMVAYVAVIAIIALVILFSSTIRSIPFSFYNRATLGSFQFRVLRTMRSTGSPPSRSPPLRICPMSPPVFRPIP